MDLDNLKKLARVTNQVSSKSWLIIAIIIAGSAVITAAIFQAGDKTFATGIAVNGSDNTVTTIGTVKNTTINTGQTVLIEWKDLTLAERQKIREEAFALFPRLVDTGGKQRKNWPDIANWLRANHAVAHPHTLDLFRKREANGYDKMLVVHIDGVLSAIATIDQQRLRKHWGVPIPSGIKDRMLIWLSIIEDDLNTEHYTIIHDRISDSGTLTASCLAIASKL